MNNGLKSRPSYHTNHRGAIFLRHPEPCVLYVYPYENVFFLGHMLTAGMFAILIW